MKDVPVEKLIEYIRKQKVLVDLSRKEIHYALNDDHRLILRESHLNNKELLKILQSELNKRLESMAGEDTFTVCVAR